jgi:putative ABC transport system permease protein
MEKTLMQKHPENTPPKYALRFLRWFCPSQLCEGIEGDLLEQFDADVKMLGAARAGRRFTWHVLRFFRPGIFLRNRLSLRLNSDLMLGNYFKVAARNIQKRKLYSFINAFGLSIGLAFCMLIYLYIEDERSFDQFHENKDRIYRVEYKMYNYFNDHPDPDNRYFKSAYVQSALKDALKAQVPEVQYAARFREGWKVILKYGDKKFPEKIHYTDPDFFKMFSFRLLAGNKDKLFKSKYDVAITQEIAEKYFGSENPVGKTLIIRDDVSESPFTVSAVIAVPPANSSLDFTVLVPQENRKNYERSSTNWSGYDTPLLIQLYPGSEPTVVEQKIENLAETHLGKFHESIRKAHNLPSDTQLLRYNLTPLPDWHLKHEIYWHKVSSPDYGYILGGIAFLILLIACINYVSLALTTSVTRRVEVGIRKVVGALKNQLVFQFGFESILLSFMAMSIGVGLVVLFLPVFNDFTGKAISLSSASMCQLVGAGVALALVAGLLAGCYPAIVVAGSLPAKVLKGRFTANVQAGFTKPLVVLQFALSSFLIISSVVMYRQMEFVTTKDLGYDPEQIIVIPTEKGHTKESDRVVDQIRTRLTQEPEILAVAGTDLAFSEGLSRIGYDIHNEEKQAYVYTVDPYYISLLNMKLISGRNFDSNIPSDSSAVIVNEALVADMKWTDLDEAYLNWDWSADSTALGAKVIGVVADFHYQSLFSPIEPAFLTMNALGSGHLTTILVKIQPGKIPVAIGKIRHVWNELYPNEPFDYSFLDENVAKQYESQQRWLKTMGLSTAFAILISCLGLFGLAGINAVNRTKEIGIRKVLGANLSSIFALLNRQYIWLSLIAFGLAIPFSWYAMDKWLSTFQFRITIRWELFAISMAVGLAVALLTVSYHGIKAAMVNPAETLKSE